MNTSQHSDTGQPTILIIENEVSNRILIERCFPPVAITASPPPTDGKPWISSTANTLTHPDRPLYACTGWLSYNAVDPRASGPANVPIVAVTAYALNDENEAALHIGCNEYLTKPFKPRQLWKW